MRKTLSFKVAAKHRTTPLGGLQERNQGVVATWRYVFRRELGQEDTKRGLEQRRFGPAEIQDACRRVPEF